MSSARSVAQRRKAQAARAAIGTETDGSITCPASVNGIVGFKHHNGAVGAGSLAAIAGYPHLTVPMRATEGLPVGLSLIGTTSGPMPRFCERVRPTSGHAAPPFPSLR